MRERRAPSYTVQVSCPHCGVQFDATSAITTARPPDDGDLSICGRCRRLSAFVVGPLFTAVRLLTPAEEERWRSDPAVKATLGALIESYDSWDAADLAYRADAQDGGDDG